MVKDHATITMVKESPSADARGDGPVQAIDAGNPSQGQQLMPAHSYAVAASEGSSDSAAQYSLSAVHVEPNGGHRHSETNEANHQIIRSAFPFQEHASDAGQTQTFSHDHGHMSESPESSHSVHSGRDASTKDRKRGGGVVHSKARSRSSGSTSSMDVNLDDVPSDSSSEHTRQGSTGRDNARRCSVRYQRHGRYSLPIGIPERLQRAHNHTRQIQIAGIPDGPPAHMASPHITISEDEDSESGA